MKSAGFKPPIYGIRAITVCKSGLLTTCYNWDDPPSSDIPGSYPNVTHEGAEFATSFPTTSTAHTEPRRPAGAKRLFG